jgi:hypothetical protein
VTQGRRQLPADAEGIEVRLPLRAQLRGPLAGVVQERPELDLFAVDDLDVFACRLQVSFAGVELACGGEDLVPAVGAAAAGVLRFSEERDPAVLTQFVRLRVIDPERAYWLRGIEAATRWLRESGNSELRVPYTYVTPDDWPGIGGHPLGVWVADQRRYYTAGTLETKRVAELEALGMMWSVHASAWDAGLAVARDYATVHGHLLPGAAVIWDGFALGTWLKNQRAAARKARENAARRANGETGLSYAGELSESRMEALTEVDPGWAPEWEISWQRSYRLILAHVKAGGALPAGVGKAVVQGEDLVIATDHDASDPRDLLRGDFLSGLLAAVVFASAIGISAGATGESWFALALGLISLLAAILVANAWTRYVVLLLCTRGRLPWRLGAFLNWAYGAGLLRISGNAYQFRHRELQDWLARHAAR